MAQNITWLGASYSDVPAVTLPKTGGGTARFDDTTDANAAASDIASGKTAYVNGVKVTGNASGGGTEAGTVTQDANGYLVLDDDPYPGHITVESLSVTQNGTYTATSGHAYSPVTVAVSGGGGGGNMSDPIRFFDYDGTLVASYSSVPNSLPSVPTHTGLTNGTWNYTLEQITTKFNAMGTCDVGANYDTVSGATEIDIVLQDGRLHPYLSLAVNGTVTIDWGDNSTSTATGTSYFTRIADIHHEYAAAGSYTIKIRLIDGTKYSFCCTSTYPLLNGNFSTVSANSVYANCVKAVRVGVYGVIETYAFYYCYSLASISMPSEGLGSSIGTYAFSYCYSLKFVALPYSVTSAPSSSFGRCYSLVAVSMRSGSFGESAFSYCYSLTSITIPSGVINNSVFSYCYSLASVTIPSATTSIGSSAFSSCYSLASVTVPSNVTSIKASAFSSCYGMAEYHFKPTTPPTLANTSAFNNIPSDCVMYVPYSADHSVLEAYQTANNWSTYASYMQEEPQ